MQFFLKKFFLTNFLLLFFLSVQLLSGDRVFAASSSASIDYEKARSTYQSFFKSKKKMHRRDKWVFVIQKFELVYKKYYPSNEAYKAIFTMGSLYERLFLISRRKSDLDEALQAYKKTINQFKPGNLTDDALYRRGEIFFSREKYDTALNSFNKVSNLTPKGDLVEKAESRASNLRSIISRNLIGKKISSKQIENVSYLSKSFTPTSGKKLTLDKVNYTVGSDSFRIVVHTSEAVTFSQGRLTKPERVYINFNKTQLTDSVDRDIKIGSRFLKGLRLSQFDKNNTRLVVDLNNSNNLKVGVWSEGPKLFVELSNKNTQDVKKNSISKTSSITKVVGIKNKAKLYQETRKILVKVTKNRSRSVVNKKLPLSVVNKKSPLIVVDAGHGGKDLGAKGYRGLKEKDVNLGIALRLQHILKTRYKYRVVLTRKDDTFIPLPGRGKIANDNNADIFVSVHANSAPRRTAYGIETYYLGQGHSEEAKATAARENGKLVKSVKDDQTQEILASMISTTKINKSSRLAGNIQNHLYQSMRKKYSGIKNLGVKEGPFFVLHDTNMASVLVEVGFLSNSREESRLKKNSYLDQLASSIAKGIAKFVQDSDPMI
jgi:N-acetylmuramoyl-L-alanine amidase